MPRSWFILGLVLLAGCQAHTPKFLSASLIQGTFRDRVRTIQLTRVAVLPFENFSGTPEATNAVTDLFSTALFRAHRYSIKERAESLRLLKEKNVTVTGGLTPREAAKLGQTLGVEGVFIGTITEYTYLFYPEDAVIGLYVSLVDVETEQIVWSGVINDRSAGLLQPDDEPLTQLTSASVRSLIEQLAPPPEENAQAGAAQNQGYNAQ